MNRGSGEHRQNVSEKDILERVAGKFKTYLEAKKKNIMAAVQFNRRRQQSGESFDTFVAIIKLLAMRLYIAESDKLIHNAIACKLLDERVRQKCLEKSKGLTLDTAIDIGRMFEATKDGMQVMAGGDPRVEINTLAGKNVAPRKRRKTKQSESKGKPQAQKCMQCGYTSHKLNEKCMAKNASYRRCNKSGTLLVCAKAPKFIPWKKIIQVTMKNSSTKICICCE